MKRVSWAELLRSIDPGNAEPVYLFTGAFPEPGRRARGEWAESRARPEEYLRSQALRSLREKLVDAAFREFNFVEVSAAEHSLDEISLLAAQLPAFTSRRMVVVTDLDRRFKPRRFEREAEPGTAAGSEILDSSSVMAGSEDDQASQAETMIAYLQNPVDSTTLILIWDRPDRKLRLARTLLEVATVVEFPRLSDGEAHRWARDYLKQQGCSIEPAAWTLLVGRVGPELTYLSHELDKLVNKSGEGMIRQADVETLTPRLREHFNFELLDQIASRRTDSALRLARRRLKDGEQPLMMLGTIAGYYRRAILAKELLTSGASPEEVAAVGRVASFKSTSYVQQLRKTPIEELLAALKRIAEVDDAIKGSRATPALQLEMLVYKLCNPALLH